jgi:glycine dehydrogenase subunit 1
MRYLPHTEAEIAEMLSVIGVSSVDELFHAIPEDRRFPRPLALEPALDEAALMAHLTALSDRNEAARALSFLGAGAYDHHVPPAVDQLLNRSEFYTAYTPYQAELSQGTLQAIFEFQTVVCQLLGMDVANASMYDAASASAEAVLMARRITGRAHVVVSEGLHPEYIETIRAYLSGVDGEPKLTTVALGPDGRTDVSAIRAALRDESAAVIVGYPNFLGVFEDLTAVRAEATARGALLVTATSEPYALAVAKSPGELGADIAVGEGQPLAVRPQFGGPGVGLFACKKSHLRQMPGRLCGETVDQDGKRGFVLTLSTREQHIRRERATSNICTNHGLIALAMVIRTALLGRKGFEAAGRLCLSRATYLKERLAATGAFELPYAGPTFNEFTVRRKAGPAAPLLASLAQKGILAGVDLGQYRPEWSSDFLVAVTERHAKADLDRLVAALVEG